MDKIKEARYNPRKKSLSIAFVSGRKIGFIGNIAKIKFNQINTLQMENRNNENEKMQSATFKEFDKFKEMVKEMRRHQRAYFKDRSNQSLKWAKEAEKKVDAYIRNYESPEIF